MTVTCDEFLASVKRLVTVPASQSLLEDSDILALATDIQRDTLTPMIMSVDEEYFIMKSVPTPIVVGQTSYRIPSRAVARKLREIKIVNEGGIVSDFPKINIERTQVYRSSSVPFGFHFLGDRVELVPSPATTGYSLLFYWPGQPGKFVKLQEAAVVTNISGDDVTLDALPATYVANTRMDFIEGVSGNWYLGLSALVTNVAGNTLTFETGTVPTDLAVGDYIALTGQSPVLQIPDEGAPLLQTLTAYDVLGTISDFEGQQRLEPKIKLQKENFLKVISPRIDGEPNIIINDRGLLRGRIRRNWAGLYRG